MKQAKSSFIISTLKSRLAIAIGAALILLAHPAAHALSIYDVHLNTAAFAGQVGTIRFLAFDLIDGDSASANNTVTARDLATDGTLGSPANVVLQDTGFFNEELRDITFGTYLDFTLSLTENNLPPGLDEFSFFVLDSSSFLPIVSSDDPTGADSLFAIDIDGSASGVASVFSSLTPDFDWAVTLRAQSAVPESGSTLPLLVIAFLGVFAVAHHRCVTSGSVNDATVNVASF